MIEPREQKLSVVSDDKVLLFFLQSSLEITSYNSDR